MNGYKIDAGFCRHEDVQELARHLDPSKLDPRTLRRLVARGVLVTLYCHVAERREDGVLEGVTDGSLSDWGDWPDPKEFKSALVASHVLDDGTNTLNGWAKRAAPFLEKRQRLQEWRSKLEDGPKTGAEEPKATRSVSDTPRSVSETPRSVSETLQNPMSLSLSSSKEEHHLLSAEPTDDDSVTEHSPDEDPGEPQPSQKPKPDDKNTPTELLRRWNLLADDLALPRAKSLTAGRARRAASRIREGLLRDWDQFSAALRASRWHLGENDRGWKADLDWILRPDKWQALVEKSGTSPPESSEVREDPASEATANDYAEAAASLRAKLGDTQKACVCGWDADDISGLRGRVVGVEYDLVGLVLKTSVRKGMRPAEVVAQYVELPQPRPVVGTTS